MKVVILCGGQGTRMREHTEFIPKPLVEIGGKPILWHIMKTYAHYGFNEFILCLGYKGNMIKDYFMNYDTKHHDITMRLKDKHHWTHYKDTDVEDWTITLADTGENTMTGGRIKRIQKYIDGDEFFVTYGDGVADIDIKKLLEFHRKMGKLATLSGIRPVSRFGVIDHEQGLITNFQEKPRMKERVNGGYFVFNKKVFDYIQGDDTVLEEEPVRKLAAERQISIFEHDGFWECMDTYRESLMLNKLWDSGKAVWKVWK